MGLEMKISISLNWTLQMLTAKTGLSQVRCPEGVLVRSVLKAADVITEIDAIRVSDPRDFRGIAFFRLEEASQRYFDAGGQGAGSTGALTGHRRLVNL